MAATDKNYKLPYTLFSSRKHPRIIDIFRLRNIENDLNDWQKHMEAYFDNETVTETKNGTVEFTTNDSYLKQIVLDIAKTGYDIIGVTSIRADKGNFIIQGWNAKMDQGVLDVNVLRLEQFLAVQGVMNGATATSNSTLNTSATPNTVTTTTTINPQKITRANESAIIYVKVVYRKNYTAYAEKEA